MASGGAVEVAPGVMVWTSRRERTTSAAVTAGGGALVVDPAWDPDELSRLADDLRAAGLTVTACFATHAHHDHLLWHPGLGAAPRWSSAGTADEASRHHQDLVDALGPGWPADLAQLVGDVRPCPPDRVPWSGPEAQLITHDGHARGHTALWLPERGVLIAGDMLSDVELPLPEADSGDAESDRDRPSAGLLAYSAGLDALRSAVDAARVLIPGHGRPTVRPRQRWEADRRYVDALLAGRNPSDVRRGLPGMAAVHQDNRRLAGLFR